MNTRSRDAERVECENNSLRKGERGRGRESVCESERERETNKVGMWFKSLIEHQKKKESCNHSFHPRWMKVRARQTTRQTERQTKRGTHRYTLKVRLIGLVHSCHVLSAFAAQRPFFTLRFPLFIAAGARSLPVVAVAPAPAQFISLLLSSPLIQQLVINDEAGTYIPSYEITQGLELLPQHPSRPDHSWLSFHYC